MKCWSFADFHKTVCGTLICICKLVSWWCHGLTIFNWFYAENWQFFVRFSSSSLFNLYISGGFSSILTGKLAWAFPLRLHFCRHRNLFRSRLTRWCSRRWPWRTPWWSPRHPSARVPSRPGGRARRRRRTRTRRAPGCWACTRNRPRTSTRWWCRLRSSSSSSSPSSSSSSMSRRTRAPSSSPRPPWGSAASCTVKTSTMTIGR